MKISGIVKISGTLKLNISETLFFAGTVPLLAQYIMGVTSNAGIEIPSGISSMLTLVGLLFWVMAIFRRNTVKNFVIQLGIIAYLYMNSRIVENSMMLLTITMLFASKDIPYEKIIKFLFRVYGVVMPVLIVVYLINLSRGAVKPTMFRTIDGVVQTARYSFYFNQPNSFSLDLFVTILMFYYLYYDKVQKVIVYGLMAAASIFIYCFPNTKTVSVMFFFLILLDIVGRKKWDCVPLFIRKNIFAIIFGTNVMLVLLYKQFPSNSILMEIDDLFTWRLRACVQALTRYGISITGRSQNQSLMSYDYMCIDNLYWDLLVVYGVITAFFIFCGMFRMTRNNTKYSKEIFCVIAVLLYGFTEYVVCPLFAFPTLFYREYMLGKPAKKEIFYKKPERAGEKT